MSEIKYKLQGSASVALTEDSDARTATISATAASVGADPDGTASAAVTAHNDLGPAAHGGILAASPNHIPMDITPTDVPTTEGTLSWNPTDHTLNVQSEIAGSVLQVGQEQWVRCVNKTGAPIADGKVVYVNGAQGNRPTIALADADNTTADSIIGVTTAAIADNDEGYVTVNGLVRGVDTSGFVAGDMLYVSSTAGELTKTAPTPPAHANMVGVALNATNNGTILVCIHRGEELADLHDVLMTTVQDKDSLGYEAASALYKPMRMLDATGFPNRTDTSATVNGNNLDIAKTGTSFDVFVAGRRLNYTATQSADISTDLDETFVYWDANGIQSSTTPWDIEAYAAPAFIAYRNNAATPAVVVFEERHAALRNRVIHAWAHETIGARYKTGLGATFDGTSFSIATGSIRDEDILLTLGSTATAGRLWYRHTGGAAMTWVENRTIPYAGSTSQAQWDNAGTLADVDTGKYLVSWVYMTNAMTYPIAIVAGQAQYATLAAARNASLPTLPTLTTREWKLIYRAIWQQGAGSVSFSEAADFREVSTGPGSSYTPASHTALTDRDAALSHPLAAIDITGATADTDPDDTDEAPIYSADATANRKVTLANLKTYFQAGLLATGMTMEYVGTTAPTGWIMLTGASAIRTIGDASSGASRANADTEDLFTLLWDSMADAQAPVSSGRGASAAADFSAHKTITIPDPRGRAVIGTGTGSGLTARTHGATGGAETHQLSAAELASHTHGYQTANDLTIGGGNGYRIIGNSAATIATTVAGSDSAHANMQPWLALHIICKL